MANITDRYLLDMDDASPVFLCIQKWIDQAKEYYTAETEATEYSKIIQDHALAYKYLTFFECSQANQAKMHKRRADLLEDLIALLNQTYYLAICREVWYELGMTYSNILDIKLDALEQTMKHTAPTPHALKKVNDLCSKSIKNFTSFVVSYCNVNTEELKSDLSQEEIVPVAYAYFQMGRLWYKFVTPDKNLQKVHCDHSLKNYQLFVAVAEKHKAIAEEMKGEVGVSKEMVSLLPLKIQKILSDIAAESPVSN